MTIPAQEQEPPALISDIADRLFPNFVDEPTLIFEPNFAVSLEEILKPAMDFP
jgi:hypothetical protein